MKKYLISIAILSVYFLVVPVIPQTTVADETPKYGGTLVAWAEEPPTLNPLSPGWLTTYYYTLNPLHDCLLFLNLTGGQQIYQPVLATSWELSSDGLSYTFHLRKDVRFHDGINMTSKDVKFTFEWMRDQKATYWAALIDNVETPDNYTAVVNLVERSGPWLGNMAVLGQNTVLPEHILNVSDPSELSDNELAIGCGPFKFVEWAKADHMTFEAFDGYWKGRPYLDRQINKSIPDPAIALISLEAGEIDILDEFKTFSEIDRLEDTSGIDVHVSTAVHKTVVFGFYCEHPIFKYKEVRQALAYAVNRTEVLEAVAYGQGIVQPYPLPVVQWGTWMPPDISENYRYEYNLAKAEQMLDEAGFPRDSEGNRFSASFMFTPKDSDLYEIFRDQFKKVGFDLTPQMVDTTTFNALQNAEPPGFETLSQVEWVYYDPHGLYRRFHTDNIPVRNMVRFKNATLDALLDQGAAEPDFDKRYEIYDEVQRIIAQEVPTIKVYSFYDFRVSRSEYQGLEWSNSKWCQDMTGAWWTMGSEISPSIAWETITTCETELIDLQGRGYNVTAALSKLEEAKQAYSAGDYVMAQMLADEASKLVVPPPAPIALYAGIVVAVVLVAGATLYYMRRRKKST